VTCTLSCRDVRADMDEIAFLKRVFEMDDK